MGVQGTTSISVEQEGRCWVGEDFTEEVTFESLEIRC